MKILNEYSKPIIVLFVICLIASVGLALTNAITAPIIEQNEIDTAIKLRQELLPDASGFTALDVEYEGIVDFYKADNIDAYILTAQSKGFDGPVPVMVAFGEDGNIAAVKFLSNGETPGLGQRVFEDWFTNQFSNLPAETLTLGDIDKIASATITSSAALSAINLATNAYVQEVGGTLSNEVFETEEEILANVLPEAGALTLSETTSDTVSAIYTAENGGKIVVGRTEGFYKKDLFAYVGFDADGKITGVYIDASLESEGIGTQATGTKFGTVVVEENSMDNVDVIAGATVSSEAAKLAMQNAIDAKEVA